MNSQEADEAYHSLALLHSPGIGHANAKFALSHFSDLSSLFTASKNRLAKIPGIGDKAIKGIQSKSGFEHAERITKDADKAGIKIIPFHSSRYPTKLRQIMDAPFVLYYKGSLDLDYKRSVGVVGTRDASEYGKEVTQRLVSEMKTLQPLIISGLAYGIDIEAHRSALSNGLDTIGVLAGGLDRIYPSIHHKTADKMLQQGGLLSEQPPGIKPDAHFFPARNRIIAGLSDALIVVEAKEKGGALITAALSDSYDRTVFAVPGNLGQKTSDGCNRLIRNQKALIYTSASDLVYHLGWEERKNSTEPAAKALPELSDNESKVYQILASNGKGIAIDELAWKSEIQINLLSSVLLTLEFKGLVKALPGKKYQGIR